jgi:hypothetical protein
MGRIAHICPHCRRIVPARQRCGCRPRTRTPDTRTQADRVAQMPWRAFYRHPSYKRNRLRRYNLVGGQCEKCRALLKGKLHPHGMAWECDHHSPARLFASAETANAVENLRCYCVRCHRDKKP